ncbi:MAG: tetratricopeptide repeat protein [Spirochaetales bacterium]|nr:tetratricopeptide repeat protein [Spirochaetales bacterium]
MPRIEDINELNDTLKTLGSEEEILRSREETIEDVTPPEETLPADLSDLLGGEDFGDEFPPDVSDMETGEEVPLDIDSGTVPTDDTGAEFPEPPEGMETTDLGGFDIPDLSGESGTADFEDIETHVLPEDSGATGLEDTGLPEESSDISMEDLGDINIPDLSEEAGMVDFEDIEGAGLPEDSGVTGLEDTGLPEEPSDFGAVDIGDIEIPGLSEEAGTTGIEDTGLPEEPSNLGAADIGDIEAETLPDEFASLSDESTDFSLPEDLSDLSDILGTETPPDVTDTTTESMEEEGIPTETLPDEFSHIGETSFEEEGTTGEMETGEQPADTFGTGEALDITSGDEFKFPEDIDLSGFTEETPGEETVPPETMESESVEQPEDTGGLPEGFTLPEDLGMEAEGVDSLSGFTEPELTAGTGVPSGEGRLEGEGEFLIDEFSLPDLDESLDTQKAITGGRELPPDESIPSQLITDEAQERMFTDKEFTAIRRTLDSLPQNLKIIIQDLIGNSQVVGDNLDDLISALIHGSSPREIVTLVSGITGKRIKIPKRFEKKSGLAFEEERKSFAYAFRENILPFLKVLFPTMVVIGLLVFGGFALKARLDALGMYEEGLKAIQTEKKYDLGNELFDRAKEIYTENEWYYKYAKAFINQGQMKYAEDKYMELLSMDWKNETEVAYINKYDEKGILDYADMQSRIQAKFKKAESLLNSILHKNSLHPAALLASGDNYMDWAEIDPSKYENAREKLSIYKFKYGDTKELLFKFMKYFIRTDNKEQVYKLKDRFSNSVDVQIDPYVYSELGGYLIDKEDYKDVKRVLFKAKNVDEKIPEIHFNLSRYFEALDEKGDEETSLLKTIQYLDSSNYEGLNNLLAVRKKLLLDIKAHSHLGALYFDEDKLIDSRIELEKSVELIENKYGQLKKAVDALQDEAKKRVFRDNAVFGETYYNRGNYFFKIFNYGDALADYNRGRSNGYVNPELYYKSGFIRYFQSDFRNALLDFHEAEEIIPQNDNLLFAAGNTFYLRKDYHSAFGYYQRLIDLLELKKSKIPYLKPKEDMNHRGLLNLLMKAYNNIGITTERLSKRVRDPKKEADTQYYLTRSIEYYDYLDRLLMQPDSLARDTFRKNLAYNNQQVLLNLTPGSDVYIYKQLPVDTKIEYASKEEDFFFREE